MDGKKVSRLPTSQRVEMIVPTLLKAISKFGTTNKLFKWKPLCQNQDALKSL